MNKDDSVYLGHMLDQALKVVGKVNGKARDDFDADENLRLALAHLVQTIGEAARHVTDILKEAQPRGSVAEHHGHAPPNRTRLHERRRGHPPDGRDHPLALTNRSFGYAGSSGIDPLR